MHGIEAVGTDIDSGSADFPLLEDGSGYALSPNDFVFLCLPAQAAWRLAKREAPLGMSPEQFESMVKDLAWALSKHGVSDCDVRLQGSSAHAFSGSHKEMPRDRTEVADLMSEFFGEPPLTYVLDGVIASYEAHWPVGNRPKRRPFDALHRLSIDPDPSDYDVQLSSDQMISQVAADLARLGIDPHRMRVRNRTYEFVEKRYAEKFFTQVREWALDYTATLGRPVNWALFPATGPSEFTEDPVLSSHFKSTDWVVLRPALARQSGEG